MTSNRLAGGLGFILVWLWCGTGLAGTPTFSVAVSEYPSWSGTFLTAMDIGLIDGDAGKLGPLEEKWGIDIVIKDTDYDSCISLFMKARVDAACLTNIDSLAPSVTRKAVAILPTSTSAGADACIAQSTIMAVPDIKALKVNGLASSVSEYAFDKCLEALGEKASDYSFENMDPVQVGAALQGGSIDVGMTWNPVVMQTLKAKPELKRLFDSSLIKGHIVDMVVASRDSLATEGGKSFACALIDTYYTVCNLMENPDTKDQMLTAMGKRFARLGLEDMKVIVKETSFYSTPDKGLAEFGGTELPDIMKTQVVPWVVNKGLVEKGKEPTISFTSGDDVNLCFDSQYITAYQGTSPSR